MEACRSMHDFNELELIEQIQNSFKGRTKPFITSSEIARYEEEGLERFLKLDEFNYSGENLEEHYDILFFLNKSVLCYYLPFVLVVSLKEKEPDLLINGTIISMLGTNYGDDEYRNEWGIFTLDEISAIKDWVMWLLFNSSSLDEHAVSKAYENLSLLK